MSDTEFTVSRIVVKPDYGSYRPDVADGLRKRVEQRHVSEVRSTVDRCVNQVIQDVIGEHDDTAVTSGSLSVSVTFEPMTEPQTGATATLVLAVATLANNDEKET